MRKFKMTVASLAIAGMTLTAFPYAAFASDVLHTRLAGLTAVETAQEIANEGWTTTKNVVLAPASAENVVDALASGPLAATLDAPILLTEGDKLSQTVIDEITSPSIGVENVYVTSGNAVIKDNVIKEIKDLGKNVILLGGFDQYETAVNIAKKTVELGGNTNTIYIANGENAKITQDALSIGAIAANGKQPILLTQKGELPKVVKDYIDGRNVTNSVVVGGTAVVSDTVKAALPGTVDRVWGNDAYDTNLEVLKKFNFDYTRVYLANGETEVDALAGVPLAARTNSPIIISNGSLKSDVYTFLQDELKSDSVITALGGTAVVTDDLRTSVEDQVAAYAAFKGEVMAKVNAYADLANGDLSTQALVDTAKAAGNLVDLTGLNAADKTAAQATVDAATAKVTAAQAALDPAAYDTFKAGVMAKVNTYATLANGDLSTQALVDAAKAAGTLVDLTGLTDADKTAAQVTVDAAAAKVTAAQTVLDQAAYTVLKAKVQANVDAYVKLANGDLSTQTLVDAAKAAKVGIDLTGLTASDQSAFQTKISAADYKVTAAQTVINDNAAYAIIKNRVQAEVDAYVTLANGDLSTQALIDAANTAKAEIVLSGLTYDDIAVFQNTINTAAAKVTAAQTVIDQAAYTVLKAGVQAEIDAYVTLANGDLSTQALVDAAKAAGALVDLTGLNAADQSALQVTIDAADAKVAAAQTVLYPALKAGIQAKIDAYVTLANGDLSTQALVDAAKAAGALVDLTGLTDADKSAAQVTVDAADAKVVAAQAVLDQAYATLKAGVQAKVDAYVTLANGDLSTQALVDAAKAAKAGIDLTGLTASDQSAFQTKINAADYKVTTAQTVINDNAAYAVIKNGVQAEVDAYVTLANGDLSTQALIDAANTAKAKIVMTGLTYDDKVVFQNTIDLANAKVTAAQANLLK